MTNRTILLCSDITAVDTVELPTDVSIRSYRPGDYTHWERITREYTQTNASEISFETIRADPSYRPHRTIFVIHNESVVATATVGVDPDMLPETGKLRHVAVADAAPPGTILTACAAAIRVIEKEGMNAMWAEMDDPAPRDVLEKLGFKTTEISLPEHRRDHTDYAKRFVPLKRWHGNRPIGESTGMTGDARGDESLYRSSRLGYAEIDTPRIKANENRPFSITYTAGECELYEGATIIFWSAGQGTLGTTPQAEERDFPGFVECETSSAATIETMCTPPRVFSKTEGENPPGGLHAGDMVVGTIAFGFHITKGRLRTGDQVTVHVGKSSGFHWTKLAGVREIKVILDSGGGEPRMRLPAPLTVRIEPLAAAHLEVILPGSAAPGSRVIGRVRMCDRFDNRVDYSGEVAVERAGTDSAASNSLGSRSDAGSGTASPAGNSDGAETGIGTRGFLSEGIGTIDLGEQGTAPVHVQVHTPDGELSGSSNQCIPSDGMQLFFGDMHTHDFHSTAAGYPADCYLWAKDEKNLDFVSIPIQVHRWLDNEKWVIAKHFCEYFLEEGRFVTFLAFEWQHSHYGDKVIHYLGGDMPYLPIDDPRYAYPARLYEALRGTDAFIISHHPGYELDLHVPGTRWDSVENDVDRLAEIWSMHGSSEGFDPNDRPLLPPRRAGGVYAGLRHGVRMGIVAGSDTHTARPGGAHSEPRPYFGGMCGIWAERLTRRALFEAFLSRRTYALTGARIVLRFEVNGYPMGSECALTEERVISAEVWAPGDIERIQFLRDTEVIAEYSDQGDHAVVRYVDNRSEPAFYHYRVVQTDGEMAVCSPVWIGDTR